MIIVTGGAGFIGSNLIKGLNDEGYENILVVDNLKDNSKFKNLLTVKYIDFIDKSEFRKKINTGYFEKYKIKAIFHQGACSNTMEYNGNYMMDNNYEYSKDLLHFALRKKISYIYASSASVYGFGKNGFIEKTECEQPLNIYAFSKKSFDNYVGWIQKRNIQSQIIGLRYFNVFGPNEAHKGKMTSIVYQIYQQIKDSAKVKLFKGIDGYNDGEQKRDFIYVKDVIKINLWFFKNPQISGIFNCGTGNAQNFNEVSEIICKILKKGEIQYIDFPKVLIGKYQNYTQADMRKTEEVGLDYKEKIISLEQAIQEYCFLLETNGGFLY